MRTGLHTIDAMKSSGFYFAAGALAYSMGCTSNYGCHFGMRSELDNAKDEYSRGWHAARTHKATINTDWSN